MPAETTLQPRTIEQVHRDARHAAQEADRHQQSVGAAVETANRLGREAASLIEDRAQVNELRKAWDTDPAHREAVREAAKAAREQWLTWLAFGAAFLAEGFFIAPLVAEWVLPSLRTYLPLSALSAVQMLLPWAIASLLIALALNVKAKANPREIEQRRAALVVGQEAEHEALGRELGRSYALRWGYMLGILLPVLALNWANDVRDAGMIRRFEVENRRTAAELHLARNTPAPETEAHLGDGWLSRNAVVYLLIFGLHIFGLAATARTDADLSLSKATPAHLVRRGRKASRKLRHRLHDLALLLTQAQAGGEDHLRRVSSLIPASVHEALRIELEDAQGSAATPEPAPESVPAASSAVPDPQPAGNPFAGVL